MLRTPAHALSIALVALSAASGGCGDGSFHVERTPELPRGGGTTLSVFGVYRDGRLAPEAWDSFRSHLTPLFGASACEPGYPEVFAGSQSGVVQAVDDFTRGSGVTDELLDRVAVAAKGELVLVIALTGRPGMRTETEAPRASAPVRPGRRGTPSTGAYRVSESVPFEAVGIFFSRKAHRSVGAMRLAYGGPSLDEALETFMTRLGGELPRAVCAGWSPDLRLEVGDIRRLEAQ